MKSEHLKYINVRMITHWTESYGRKRKHINHVVPHCKEAVRKTRHHCEQGLKFKKGITVRKLHVGVLGGVEGSWKTVGM